MCSVPMRSPPGLQIATIATVSLHGREKVEGEGKREGEAKGEGEWEGERERERDPYKGTNATAYRPLLSRPHLNLNLIIL